MVVDTLQKPGEARRGFFAALAQKANETLDGTGSFHRRRAADPDGEGYPARSGGGGGVNLPQSFVLGLIMYLIASAVSSVWWAATQQSRNESQSAEITRLNQKVEVLDLQLTTQQSNMDERIRGKVREALNDWGYYRPDKER